MSELAAGRRSNGGRCSRKTTYEKTPTKVKNIAAAANAIRSKSGFRICARMPLRRRPLLRAGGPTSGSQRRMTNTAASGNTARPPTAQRQPTTDAASATPTRPISPPATSAET